MTCVGRERELGVLLDEAETAADAGVGRVVFVSGLPGAGKSTLVGTAVEAVAKRRPGMRIARGRCLQTFGVADPYLPFINALEDLQERSAELRGDRDSVGAIMRELAPYWLSVVPVVGGLLSAGFATAARLRGDARADVAPSREALFGQYLEVIRRLAADAPLLLYLEDLHWADQSSLALLTHLSRGIGRLPVLLVGTFRTDDAEISRASLVELVRELEREHIARRIEVGELQGGALDAMITASFGGDVAEPLRRRIVATAGGNPLFVAELAHLLMQTGAAVQERREWRLADSVHELEIPRSAEAVIEQRIERLDPDDLRILQYASVEGNDFGSTVLARLLDIDELDLLDRLDELERRHRLVVTVGETRLPDGDVSTTVKFTHALVQTVLYKQVVGKRRVLLHRRAAETLERVHAGAEKPVAGRLARHFHRGRVGASAFRYACMAGDAARRIYAHWEAEELFRIALEHSPDGEERVRLLERLGDVYDSVAYYGQGIDRYHEALGGAGRPETRVRLRRKILMLQRKASLAPPARLLDGVRGLIEEAADLPVERFHLLLELAIVPGSEAGTEPAEDALRLAETIGEEMLVISALERLGGLIATRGADTREALPYLERARVMAQRADDPPRLMLYHTLAGIAHAKMGEFGEALAEFEGMLTIAERIGDPRSVASACINLSALMLRLGRYADAEERAHHALETLERRGGEGVTQSLFNLAECARLTGDLATATARYRKLVEVAAAGDAWECEAVGRAGIGLCALASRDLDDARAEAERVLASVQSREGWFEDRDLVELFLARLEEADGNRRAAIDRLVAFSEPLRTRDTFLSARIEVQLLRLRVADGEDIVPDLEALAARVAEIQSPPLREAVNALRADIGSLAERPAGARVAS